MLLPVKLICRTNRVHEDGTCSIFVQYCYGTKKVLLHTGIKIPAVYWNKSQECITDELPIEYGMVNDHNSHLLRMRNVVSTLALQAKKFKLSERGAFIKASFTTDLAVETIAEKIEEDKKREQEQEQDKLSIYNQFDDYIESRKRKVSKATLTVYGNVKSHLQAFEIYRKEKITFNSFDFAFYEDFVDYLTFEHVHLRRQTEVTGLRLNTIGKTIKHLRGFLKDRVKRKIIPPLDLTDFKIPEEESDAIYLKYEEIAKIYQTNLSEHPQLIEYRDLFVLACLTGLRFSDFSSLRPEDLQKGMLYKKQEKSDHWVVIPLREEAKLIFTRQFKERIPALSNPEFNLHIKTIGKLAGITQLIKFSYKKGNQHVVVSKAKYDWITSHTARRSFCTNEFLAGTPVKLIMKISGHKREKDFYRYIRITPEEAAETIKKVWEERNGMRAFGSVANELT
ncbi:MAG: phage integrase SAM-like domain-containing protein [Agriterribacter sp.]